MSDLLIPLGDGVHFERWKDSGDGTHARVVIGGPVSAAGDVLLPVGDGVHSKRFHDMGDGTMAEVISLG